MWCVGNYVLLGVFLLLMVAWPNNNQPSVMVLAPACRSVEHDETTGSGPVMLVGYMMLVCLSRPRLSRSSIRTAPYKLGAVS